MTTARLGLASLAMLTSLACAAGATDPTATTSGANGGANENPGTSGGAGLARVRCEVRSGRSKVSVDGNNLRPLGGSFSARIAAGGNVATAPAQNAVGDEAEFDFDSAPDDIAAGAVAIPANFIARAAGSTVTGEILDAAGTIVATATGACRVR